MMTLKTIQAMGKFLRSWRLKKTQEVKIIRTASSKLSDWLMLQATEVSRKKMPQRKIKPRKVGQENKLSQESIIIVLSQGQCKNKETSKEFHENWS